MSKVKREKKDPQGKPKPENGHGANKTEEHQTWRVKKRIGKNGKKGKRDPSRTLYLDN